jgi:hypothetical protein
MIDYKLLILLYIVGSVIIFFVTREIWTWYFKMNKVVQNQKEQVDILKDIRNLLERSSLTNQSKGADTDQRNFKEKELERLKLMFEKDEISAVEFTRRQGELLK